MSGINTIQTRLNNLVTEAKNSKFISDMKNENSNVATWESKLWVHTNATGQRLNILFTQEMGRSRAKKLEKQTLMLSPMREVLMLYALTVREQNVGRKNQLDKIAVARAVLSLVDHIEEITDSLLKQHAKEIKTSKRAKLSNFVNFLNDQLFQHNPLRKPKIKRLSKTGDEIEKDQKEKMADEMCIAALGSILYEVIPPDKKKWNIHPRKYQRDAFVCAMSALAMGSPNRVAAEQTVLDAQGLKSHSVTENGEDKTVYYLDWKGSKGYKNNANHILGVMTGSVERSLDYILEVTEPNRVLARFYTDPELPLKKLLREKDCDPAKWHQVNPDMNKPTNMVTLGYLLGLYPEKMDVVQVPPHTKGAFQNSHIKTSKWFKPIWMLRNDDMVRINWYSLGCLLGLGGKRVPSSIYHGLGISSDISIKGFQERWIARIKEIYPKFPAMTNGTKDGECNARSMLFAFSGYQFEMANGTGIWGVNTPFTPVGPETLAACFGNEIRETRKVGGSNIFTRHGFSEEFFINPHQFRHYINHTGVESGIPKLIMNLWSGRKDPTQILHYVHTSAADQVSVISDILFNETVTNVEQAKQHIRVVSHQEYEAMTDTIASETSSGICTQQLTVTPCSYLNDFDTHCLFCSKACHVAHDEDAIALLRRDLTHQQIRLDQVVNLPRFAVSKASQDWYKTHNLQTEMLKQLLDLMTDKRIAKGSLIRLLTRHNEFRVTNLQTKQIDIVKLALPNVEERLGEILNNHRGEDDDDTTINELLELI